MVARYLFLGVKVDRHNESVKSQDLGEDQDQNHPHEESGLLGRASHPGVTHHPDSVASGQTGEADTEAGAQVNKALKIDWLEC